MRSPVLAFALPPFQEMQNEFLWCQIISTCVNFLRLARESKELVAPSMGDKFRIFAPSSMSICRGDENRVHLQARLEETSVVLPPVGQGDFVFRRRFGLRRLWLGRPITNVLLEKGNPPCASACV